MTEATTIALIGLGGVVIGAFFQICANVVAHQLQQRAKDQMDKPRKDLLLSLLKNPKYTWRRFDTLMHVIGADEETTKRLLLEVGARGSEDGQNLWGLINRNPFRETQ